MPISPPATAGDVTTLAQQLFAGHLGAAAAEYVATVPATQNVEVNAGNAGVAASMTYNAFADLDGHDAADPLFMSPFGVEDDGTFVVAYAAGVRDLAQLDGDRDPRVRHYQISVHPDPDDDREWDITAADVTSAVFADEGLCSNYGVPFAISCRQAAGEDV
jgi:hypothetical protein